MNETVKNPFERFTAHAQRVLQSAAQSAGRVGARAVGAEHLVNALLSEKGCLGYNILALNNIRFPRNVRQVVSAAPAEKENKKIPFDRTAKNIIKKAAEAAAFYGHNWIGTEHLLLGIMQCSDALKTQKSNQKITHQLEHILESTAHLTRLKTQGKERGAFAVPRSLGKLSPKTEARRFPALSFFCENLTARAREGKLSRFWGREKELLRLTSTLLRKTKNNPLLVGEAGVGKTAIVHGLAGSIAQNTAPAELLGAQIFSLDVGLMVAGTMYRGEFEARLKDIMEEAKSDEVILFIDEIHTIMGAGSASGSLDLANMLKPALAEGEIRLIAATTPEEYRASIEKNAALARRFQPIIIAEETEENTFAILSFARESYERHHGVRISDEAIRSAIRWSHKYQPRRRFPDKALDLLDETASRLRMKDAHPMKKELAHLGQKLKEKENQKRAAVHAGDYVKGMERKEEANALLRQWETVHAQAAALPSAPINLSSAHIKETLAEILGVRPLDESAPENDIAPFLAQRIIGQDASLEKISSAVARTRAGLAPAHRPIASFLFMGPSGVGKTETAKALAEAVFGAPSGYTQALSNFIRIDMSEFSEPHSIARLIGAPPGYVGFEEGGYLTEKIKQNPYALVLFDEIEKAHPHIFNILLQMLDEGMLTDAFGEHVSFRNAVIILTSNIGTEEFNKKAIGFKSAGAPSAKLAKAYETVRKNVLALLKETLRPELLNRIDHVLTFAPLSGDALKKIARKQCAELAKRAVQEKGIALEIEESAIACVTKKSHSDSEGARLMKRVIAEHIEYPLAKMIMAGKLAAGDGARIIGKGNAIIVTKKK